MPVLPACTTLSLQPTSYWACLLACDYVGYTPLRISDHQTKTNTPDAESSVFFIFINLQLTEKPASCGRQHDHQILVSKDVRNEAVA